MKKLPILLAVILSVCCLSSCLDDKGNKAEATCQYYGVCQSIVYKDSADTVMQTLIIQSLYNLGLIGDKSIFKETVSLDFSSLAVAYAICDQQANETYTKKLNLFDRKELKNDIFAHHSDSLAHEGFPTAESLPIDSLTFKLELYNASSLNPIQTYTIQR